MIKELSLPSAQSPHEQAITQISQFTGFNELMQAVHHPDCRRAGGQKTDCTLHQACAGSHEQQKKRVLFLATSSYPWKRRLLAEEKTRCAALILMCRDPDAGKSGEKSTEAYRGLGDNFDPCAEGTP